MNVPVQQRLGETQCRFRRVNERLYAAAVATKILYGSTTILCECSDELCIEALVVPVSVYRAVRAMPTRFLVRPDHVDAAEEEIALPAATGYVVVDKYGEAADTARAFFLADLRPGP